MTNSRIRKSRWGIFYVLLSVALAVFGYWSFLTTLAPMPAPMLEATGPVASATAHRRKDSIHTIRFTLRERSTQFAYPGIYPRINEVWSTIRLGSNARVLYTQDASGGAVKIWGLTLDGFRIISPEQAYEARRANGRWGLAIGIAMTLGALILWRQWRSTVV